MTKHHQQRRALRARPRVDNMGRRYLQGDNNNNKNKKDDNTPSPTFAPTMSPTKKKIAEEDLLEGSVSLAWSLLVLPKDGGQRLPTTKITGTNGVDELKNWISQDFLCFQDNVWLTSDLKTLDSDCQSTIRRHVQEEEEDDDDDNDDDQQNQPLYPDRTILLNDPVVFQSEKTLPDGKNTEYTVWDIHYPVYSYADLTNEEAFEKRLQDLLNHQINKETLVWEDGVLAVVGDEMKAFTSTNHYWRTNDNYALVELGPFHITPLQALGAIMGISQTIFLILLHIFISPYLKERHRKKKKRENNGHAKQHRSIGASSLQPQNSNRSSLHSSQRNESSRTQNYTKRDYIPKDISIPERVHRDSGSSRAYPIPY